MLVKASYFPNWQVDGADGPYRVAPNLMVVVPTDEHVELTYGRQPVEWVGYALTLLGIGLAILLATRPAVPRSRARRAGSDASRRAAAARGGLGTSDRHRTGRPDAAAAASRLGTRATVTGRLRRLALVALLPTAVDVALLVVLRQGAGWILVLADLTAIAVASVFSYVLHRTYTFRSDPFVRWVQMPAAFIGVAVGRRARRRASCCAACTRPAGSTPHPP